jgi:predicted CxxxxCH...CXXCH cytochrome family protein
VQKVHGIRFISQFIACPPSTARITCSGSDFKRPTRYRAFIPYLYDIDASGTYCHSLGQSTASGVVGAVTPWTKPYHRLRNYLVQNPTDSMAEMGIGFSGVQWFTVDLGYPYDNINKLTSLNKIVSAV